MKYPRMKKSSNGGKMPNSSKGYGAGPMPEPAMSKNSAVQKKSDMRADVTKKPSDKNPYPRGMS